MKIFGRRKSLPGQERIRRLLARTLIVIGVLFGSLLALAGSTLVFAAVIPLLGGLLLAAGPIARQQEAHEEPERPWAAAPLLVALACLAAASWLGSQHPRPIPYFILSAAAGALLAWSGSLDRRLRTTAFGGLVVLFLLNRFTIFYAFTSLGGADSFYHAWVAQTTYEQGAILSSDDAGKYVVTPAFHLELASALAILGTNVKEAAFLSMGLAQVTLPLAIWGFARRFGRQKEGLWAVALVAFEPNLIKTAVELGPGTLVLIPFAAILATAGRRGPPARAVFIILLLAIVITHQLSAFVTILLLSLMAVWRIVPQVAAAMEQPSAGSLAFAVVIFVLLLILAPDASGGLFLTRLLLPLLDAFSEAAIGSEATVVHAAAHAGWSNLLFHLGFAIAAGIAMAGSIGVFLSRRPPQMVIAFASIVVFGLAFALPLVGIGNLVTGRWLPFALAGMGLVCGGFYAWWGPWRQTGLAVVFAAMMFFSLASPNLNQDQAFFAEDRFARDQYTAAEQRAADFAVGQAPIIMTDFIFTTGYPRQIDPGANVVSWTVEHLNGTRDFISGSLVLVRGFDELHDRPFARIAGTDVPVPVTIDESLDETLSNELRIYDSGSVEVYFIL